MKINNNFFRNLNKNKKVFVIAEAGSNHAGSLAKAYKLIDIAKKAGADAVKFQSFLADEIAVKNKKYNKINKKFKKYADNLYDFYKKFQLPEHFNKKLYDYCKKRKIIFMTSIFGDKSLKLTLKLNTIFKIASFEANYLELIDKLIKAKKNIILSTGCSTENEIKLLKKFFKKKNFSKFCIMHCGSSYPLKFEDANLIYINKLKKIFGNNLIGYSDHTLGISSCLAAVTLGAKIIEKHITITKRDKSPDSFFSADFDELKLLVNCIRELEKSIGIEKKIITKSIKSMRQAQRSYYALGNFKKGTVINKKMFIALRPRVKNSLKAEHFFNMLGKKLKKEIKINSPLLTNYL